MEKKYTSCKIAVIGIDGYLGRHLFQEACQQWPDAVGTTRRRNGQGLFLDLANPDFSSLELAKTGHTHAIIAAARPNIMFCDTYPKVAEMVNVTGTTALLEYLETQNITPVFLSSDRVFDNADGGPFDENSTQNAISVYGKQKLRIEKTIQTYTSSWLIIRLSKIYGLIRGDSTFYDDMAARMTSGRMIDPPFDQIFNPTWIGDVIHGVFELIRMGACGIIHLCAEPAVTRRNLALELAVMLGINSELVPVPLGNMVETPMLADCFRQLTGYNPICPIEGLRRIAENYVAETGHE